MKFFSKFPSELGVIVLILFLIVWIFFIFLPSGPSNDSIAREHPSDEQLIVNYNQHKAEFNQLAQMLINEKTLLIIFHKGNGTCQVENQKLINVASDEKCYEFVKLFKSLGLDWAYGGSEPLWLPVSHYGLSVSGSSKG